MKKIDGRRGIDHKDIRCALMGIMPLSCLIIAFWLCGLIF